MFTYNLFFYSRILSWITEKQEFYYKKLYYKLDIKQYANFTFELITLLLNSLFICLIII